MRKSLCILGFCILLLGCQRDNLPKPLPEGEQTVEGMLTRAEISLVRRGSHLLTTQIDQYYVESSVVNLGSYENEKVTLTGRFEQNTNPRDLPVFVVANITETDPKTQEWVNRGFGISFQVPTEWHETKEGDEIQFISLHAPFPVLTIFTEKLSDAPTGVPIIIDSQKAVRQFDEDTGAESIVISRSDDQYLTLLFSPRDSENFDTLKEQWVSLLSSVKLSNNVTQTTTTSTGTGSGIPCGGVAGILCPEGYFCDISNREENIGKCRKY